MAAITRFAAPVYKRELTRLINGIPYRQLSSSACTSKQVAFAFDIDGVLKAGHNVLPAAIRALSILEGNNSLKKKVPYIFITNGGGIAETDRAQNLSRELQVEVSPHQVVQAHTVMQSLSKRFGEKPILMIGGPDNPPGACREIMKDYGFKDVYTAHDIHTWQRSSWPFSRPQAKQEKSIRLADFTQVHFSAVLVFHDSRDWGRDIQYMCDVLRSPSGAMGTVGNDKHPQPFLAFSHGDLLWGNDFATSRFGQGAFQTAFRAVYEETSGRKLEATTFGKPQKLTYEYANELLKEKVLMMEGKVEDLNVWMVGDNPASDIAGANDFGWKSALVRTGVYRSETGPPAHSPSILVDNVEVAVREALSREWQIEV
ncbi:hypothetical protein CBS101457_004216 [Exobasidium rhododendri]|nr:hypothetical protein CBS101457_004216 [Exobasidium rhododendri]